MTLARWGNFPAGFSLKLHPIRLHYTAGTVIASRQPILLPKGPLCLQAAGLFGV
jgi:hypothetical protein